MKTTFRLLLLFLATVLLLGACGKEGDNTIQFPPSVPTQAAQFLTNHYPLSQYLSSETRANGELVVMIKDGGITKEVLFSRDNQWIQTRWPVSESNLPAAVKQTLQGNAYEGYSFDFAFYIEYPNQNLYRINLKKEGSLDLVTNIDPQGEVVLN